MDHSGVAPDLAVGQTSKGICFVNVRHFVKECYGNPTWDRVLESLSEADRELANTVDSLGWMDNGALGRLFRVVDRVCGQGDLALMTDIGRFEAERDFSRTLRFFLRTAGPSSLVKFGKRGFRHFQSFGDVDVIEVPGGLDWILSDWAVDEAQCLELGAYVERILEFTGARNVHFKHPECRGRREGRCFFQHRWST